MTTETENQARAMAARQALITHYNKRNPKGWPDSMPRQDQIDAAKDLITDLLHLAWDHRLVCTEQEAADLLESALNHFKAEK